MATPAKPSETIKKQPPPAADRLSELTELLRQADRLLGDKPHGDEHYPGDALRDRINLKKPLPRR